MSDALTWPAPVQDDEDGSSDEAYVIFEYNSEEDGIVADVSRCLAAEDELDCRYDDDAMIVTHRGRDWPVPLAVTYHDRYIMVSSLAAILRERYTFFFDSAYHGETYHRLFVVATDQIPALGPRPPHLEPLLIGYDYFDGNPAKDDVIRVPYTGHDVPDFAATSAARTDRRDGSNAMIDVMLGAVFTGKLDDDKLRSVVEKLKDDPKVKEAMAGKTPEEATAELSRGLSDVLKDPEVAKNVDEARKAMDDVRALTGNPPLIPQPKPWWKFW